MRVYRGQTLPIPVDRRYIRSRLKRYTGPIVEAVKVTTVESINAMSNTTRGILRCIFEKAWRAVDEDDVEVGAFEWKQVPEKAPAVELVVLVQNNDKHTDDGHPKEIYGNDGFLHPLASTDRKCAAAKIQKKGWEVPAIVRLWRKSRIVMGAAVGGWLILGFGIWGS
ncbi:hypothetical protein BC829DRAFT_435490 [Chytridium lagenaria]|nr:hypothetical protein BC829DRAFT_435490 [Chytridium lagenaria]